MRRNNGKKDEQKSWSFYRLMLQPAIQSKKLRIPDMFARTYGDELSSVAILTVPSQQSWKVALVKEDNKLWFHEGWQDFVEYYNIGFAYFLQFIYEGNSNFEVHVFDTTACEICYPYKACNSPQGRKEPCNDHRSQVRFPRKKQHVETDISVEVSHVIQLESEDEPSLHQHDEQMHDYDLGDGDDVTSDNEELDQYRESKHSTEAKCVKRRNQSEGLLLKHEEALASAGFSKPENPFFITVIKERHLKRTPFVYVPVHFAEAYLRCRAGKLVKLEASGGRQQWPVRCTTGGHYNLGRGWIIFARDNHLKTGDMCVFELTDANKCILKVHIVKKPRI